MTASHGRASRRRRTWLLASLVTSSLLLGSEARADQIHPDMSPPEPGSMAPMPSMMPMPSIDIPQPPSQDMLKDWHPGPMPVVPPDVNGFSAPTSGMTYAAADYLVAPDPSTPSVEGWHMNQGSTCTPPPPPPNFGEMSITSSPGPMFPLVAPAALQSSPTPAPEPSTILSALALIGAVAWRRRSRG